jgi:YidC/Oxa1 family membrane protein insertase
MKRSPRQVSLLASKFGDCPGFSVETSTATDDSLLRAGVLISDYSGIALEYAFGTERPVIFLDVPAKTRNPRFRELGVEPVELALRSRIGVTVSPDELETIPRVVSELARNRAAYRARISELRDKYVYEFGRSSEVGARHIMALEAGKRQWSGETGN